MVASVWGDGTPNEAFEIPPAQILIEQAGNYLITPANAQHVIDYTGVGGHTFTLPPSVDAGNGYEVWIRNNGTGNLTIDPQGADTIYNGLASLVLGPTAVVQLLVDGANFGVLGSNGLGITAAGISVTPVGGIAATNVQAALAELDTEKAKLAGDVLQEFAVKDPTVPASAVPLGYAQANFVGVQAEIAQTNTHFTTGGAAPAFTLTPTKVQTAYAEGMRFSVKFHAAASSSAQTVGPLVVGKRYTITNFVAGDDFTNVGATSNATGISFVATGTTPTTWTNASQLTTGSVIDVSGVGAKNLVVIRGDGSKTYVGANEVTAGLITDIIYDSASGEFIVLKSSALREAILNSPTFVTPSLGTPASGDLSNCTSNTEAVGTNNTQLATTAFVQAAEFVNNDVGNFTIGSIAMLGTSGVAPAEGATVAGSSLRGAQSNQGTGTWTLGSTPAGTWRNISGITVSNTTVGTFQRIS